MSSIKLNKSQIEALTNVIVDDIENEQTRRIEKNKSKIRDKKEELTEALKFFKKDIEQIIKRYFKDGGPLSDTKTAIRSLTIRVTPNTDELEISMRDTNALAEEIIVPSQHIKGSWTFRNTVSELITLATIDAKSVEDIVKTVKEQLKSKK